MHPKPQEVDDDQLAELAREWRARATRGEQLAFGVAQAFEVELRRRQRDRDTQAQALESPKVPQKGSSRSWWKLW